VRLVRVVVADSREHRHLALVVQLCDRIERRVPEEAIVLCVGRPAGDREVRAQLAIERIALRRKQGEGPQQPTRVPVIFYPQFRLVGVRRDRMFLVARYRSATPVPVSSGILQNSRASHVPALYLYEP
jgi:hypothetical protein